MTIPSVRYFPGSAHPKQQKIGRKSKVGETQKEPKRGGPIVGK